MHQDSALQSGETAQIEHCRCESLIRHQHSVRRRHLLTVGGPHGAEDILEVVLHPGKVPKLILYGNDSSVEPIRAIGFRWRSSVAMQMLTIKRTANAVRRYKANRKNENAEVATINRELSILRRAFSLGSRHDSPLVLHNPPVEKIPENNIRVGFLERAEDDALLEELPWYLKLALVIAYHTACRLGEVMSLRWPTSIWTWQNLQFGPRMAKMPIYGDMPDALKRPKAERSIKARESQARWEAISRIVVGAVQYSYRRVIVWRLETM